MRLSRVVFVLALFVGAAGVVLLTRSAPVMEAGLDRPGPDTDPVRRMGAPPVILAAGDIADCEGGALRTGRLIEQRRGVVAALGDLAYPDGSPRSFRACYAPAWGEFRKRTRPTLGNHDVRTVAAEGYFDYFGELGGPTPQGHYSYDLGDWHIVVLNSNCAQVGGCDADSPQAHWLRDDLADVTTGNVLAYWHHPRFSTGQHGNTDAVTPLWRILDNAGGDVVLSAHDHDYQRWTPRHADGTIDAGGIRQFVVGTGGADLRAFDRPAPPSLEYRQNDHLGVLRLTLQPCGYRWEFLTVNGDTLDDGTTTGTC